MVHINIDIESLSKKLKPFCGEYKIQIWAIILLFIYFNLLVIFGKFNKYSDNKPACYVGIILLPSLFAISKINLSPSSLKLLKDFIAICYFTSNFIFVITICFVLKANLRSDWSFDTTNDIFNGDLDAIDINIYFIYR